MPAVHGQLSTSEHATGPSPRAGQGAPDERWDDIVWLGNFFRQRPECLVNPDSMRLDRVDFGCFRLDDEDLCEQVEEAFAREREVDRD